MLVSSESRRTLNLERGDVGVVSASSNENIKLLKVPIEWQGDFEKNALFRISLVLELRFLYGYFWPSPTWTWFHSDIFGQRNSTTLPVRSVEEMICPFLGELRGKLSNRSAIYVNVFTCRWQIPGPQKYQAFWSSVCAFATLKSTSIV